MKVPSRYDRAQERLSRAGLGGFDAAPRGIEARKPLADDYDLTPEQCLADNGAHWNDGEDVCVRCGYHLG